MQTTTIPASFLGTSTDDGIISIHTLFYSLTLATDRPYVYLKDHEGKTLAELFVYSSVHPMHARDDTTAISAWTIQETLTEITASLNVQSSIWREKICRFRCFPDRLVYEIEVEGEGQLWEVDYFGGYFSGQPRWGSGFFWSGQTFEKGFTPEPNTQEVNYFLPAESSTIDLTGVPLPGKDSWFFTPPPFCFAFKKKNAWVGIGVEAAAGENRFTEYHYQGKSSAFYLSLSYEGHTSVTGRRQLPSLGFVFAKDEYEAIRSHVEILREDLSQRETTVKKPAWWYEPIYCGWGSQCYLASLEKGKAPDFSRQAFYEEFLSQLERNQISPGIIVLDDKWQLEYGENQVDPVKWPDLPGFICAQHDEGRKVLLWLKAWDPEGLPADECITNAAGLPLAVDPTNPRFEERLRASVRRMLSAEGYDADGFKIDFTARIPSGPGLKKAGDLWGLELMKKYLEIIYEEAKLTKPDALVMTHTPHPYLASVLDMIRLNDINQNKDVNQAMLLRAKLASIACPHAIVDTDNWPIPSKAAWRKYLRLQPELGVPSLYYASHIDATGEALTERDYALIRQTWAVHRAGRNTPDNASKTGPQNTISEVKSAPVPAGLGFFQTFWRRPDRQGLKKAPL